MHARRIQLREPWPPLDLRVAAIAIPLRYTAVDVNLVDGDRRAGLYAGSAFPAAWGVVEAMGLAARGAASLALVSGKTSGALLPRP